MKSTFLNMLFVILSTGLLIGTLFFPIFTDEIGYFILRNRLWLDESHIILHPQCGKSSFEWLPPIAWYPITLLRGLTGLLVENPMQVRLLGIGKMIINISLILFCASRISNLRKDNLFKSYEIIYVFGSIGSLIWVMSINRPEQTLLMGYLGILSILLLKIEKPSLSKYSEIKTILGLGLFSIFLFSSHVKAIAFLPFAILAIILCTRTKIMSTLGLSVLAWISISSTLIFFSLGKCPEDAFLTYAFEVFVVNPIQLIYEPRTFLESTFSNIQNLYLYFHGILIYRNLPIGWIMTSDNAVSDVLLSIINPIWLIMLSTIFIEAVWGAIKYQSTKSRVYIVGVFSLLGLLLVSGFQSRKLFYESSFYIPILILSWGMLRSHRFPKLIQDLHSRFSALKLLTIFTSLVLIFTYLSTAASSNHSATHGFSPYHFSKEKDKISKTAKLCGIDVNSELTHLVIDDITYFSFPKLKKPFHVFYIGYPWGQGIRGKLYEFLTSWESDGIVAQCMLIPYELKGHATQGIDNYCCLGKNFFTKPN